MLSTFKSKLNTVVWTMFFCLCLALYMQAQGKIDIRVLTAEDSTHESRMQEAQTELAQDIFEPRSRKHGSK